MKVLFLVQKEQRIILDRLYDAIGEHCDLDIRWLSSNEQANLRKYYKDHVDIAQYDRIVQFLRVKKEMKQVRFLRTVPNLVFLEHDAYQNYAASKYNGRFSKLYRKMPWVRVLNSGATISRKLREEGFDSVFVPKGYDQELLYNQNKTRDIELGFIGSIKSDAYEQRKAFLEQLAKEENLLVTRTNSGDDYLNALNRIRFFVSADIGMGEYMIKNFEAMACGCVLFAYSQGQEEDEAIGFKDMQNCVLYSSMEEFKRKLAELRSNNDLAVEIARDGQRFVEENYTWKRIGGWIVSALEPTLREKPQLTGWQKLLGFLGR